MSCKASSCPATGRLLWPGEQSVCVWRVWGKGHRLAGHDAARAAVSRTWRAGKDVVGSQLRAPGKVAQHMITGRVGGQGRRGSGSLQQRCAMGSHVAARHALLAFVLNDCCLALL